MKMRVGLVAECFFLYSISKRLSHSLMYLGLVHAQSIIPAGERVRGGNTFPLLTLSPAGIIDCACTNPGCNLLSELYKDNVIK